MRHLLSLCTFLSSLWLMACQPNAIAPFNAQNISLPASYDALENARPTRQFYISAEHACADVSLNDGSSPVCHNGHGPFPDMQAVKAAARNGDLTLTPGSAVIFRDGTYAIDKLFISKSGTEQKPISILAYPGESPVFDGGYRPGDGNNQRLDKDITLGLRGKYLVMSGFTIQGCKEVCVQLGGQHILFKNNTIIGGGEDGIKVPPGSDSVYIVNNRFEWPKDLNMPSRPNTPEALDFMGAKNSYAINNLFTNSDVRWGGWGSVMWAKGGARNVHMLGNRFENLVVKNNAIILGGCCFNNWNWLAGNGLAKPVAREVSAIGNVFKNISLTSDYSYRGTIAIEGCHDCVVQDNSLDNIDDAFALYRTGASGLDVNVANAETVRLPQRISINDNKINGVKGNLYNVQIALELESDFNQFCAENPEVLVTRGFLDLESSTIYQKFSLGYDEWQAMGYDLESEMNGIGCAMDGE